MVVICNVTRELPEKWVLRRTYELNHNFEVHIFYYAYLFMVILLCNMSSVIL